MAQQPLTAKAKSAILKYVSLRGEKYGYLQHYMIELTLKADRMPREKLYDWLERRGYRWVSRHGYWKQKARGNEKRSH